MSPSRGLRTLLNLRAVTTASPKSYKPYAIRRYSGFVRAATNPDNKNQIYISKSNDPYVNLSIEHYLLQKTPADSTVLFVYINRACVIFGRNQNPWVECNLGMVRNSGLKADLVRRRSGGGTVWHDKGNVNYSVICPTPNFDRDKHAEMVVQALKKLGLEQVRVNERHDIVYDKVIDVEASTDDLKPSGVNEGALTTKTFKISGSAYKLTRLRSLHHGTCIAWTGNLNAFSRYLTSPAKPLIVARGVESVSSPVTHLEKLPDEVEKAIVNEFSSMYIAGEPVIVSDAEAEVPEIAAGMKELKSEDWIYSQTPQFTFSTDEAKSSWLLPEKFKATFTARHGIISDFTLDDEFEVPGVDLSSLASKINGRKLHEITDWVAAFEQPPVTEAQSPSAFSLEKEPTENLLPLQEAGLAMNRLFGCGNMMLKQYILAYGLKFRDFVEAYSNGPYNDSDAKLIDEYKKIYNFEMPGRTAARIHHVERE